MASVFGHGISAYAIGSSFPDRMANWRFWVLGILCTVLPDADVISFKFGIPYESFWGHRGFSHSIVFALLIGGLFTAIFFREKLKTKEGYFYILYFTLCTASHGLLDAMTNGGMGVAFFAPFDNSRYFLPWRPIQVSPLGASKFFGEWGKRVILNELFWIGIPCLVYVSLMRLIKRNN